MNEIFDDPKWRESVELTIAAEGAADGGDLAQARDLYQRAARLAGAFALSVDGAMPRTRSIAAVSAVALAALSGNFNHAVMLAEQFLASPGSLLEEGVAELGSLRASYLRTIAASAAPSSRPSSLGSSLQTSRNKTRSYFHPHDSSREAA